MKKQKIESVIQDWVFALPFQMQALLMTGMRGPDGSPKENAAKDIVRYLRGVVLKPAGDWSGSNDDSFMWGDYDSYPDNMHKIAGIRLFPSYCKSIIRAHDEFPHHFIMHLIHCIEVVGYKHPNRTLSYYWKQLYYLFCDALHMNAETEEQMDERLNDLEIRLKMCN